MGLCRCFKTFLWTLTFAVTTTWVLLFLVVNGIIRTSDIKLNVTHCERFIPSNSVYSQDFRSSYNFSVWPKDEQAGDRIIAQLRLQNVAERTKIIFAEQFDVMEGRGQFVKDDCSIKCCHIMRQASQRHLSDVIVFKGTGNGISPKSNQILVWFELESPFHSISPSIHVNWTATYRTDSTLNAPYERFVPNVDAQRKLPPAIRNYALGKTKMAAWFVSHCNTHNHRLTYVNELQKHITVDIYGECGPHKCRRGKDDCFGMLSKQYKFYLAFENANCVDYITEKFYWNGLFNDVLPVVLGARTEDYAKVAPRNSYIHVDDFESPRHLAEYLNILDKNDTLYNEYFRWKGTGSFVNTKFWCRVCAMAHEADISGTKMSYRNIEKWWSGTGVCVSPRNETIWASWRGVERKQSNTRTEVSIFNSYQQDRS